MLNVFFPSRIKVIPFHKCYAKPTNYNLLFKQSNFWLNVGKYMLIFKKFKNPKNALIEKKNERRKIKLPDACILRFIVFLWFCTKINDLNTTLSFFIP